MKERGRGTDWVWGAGGKERIRPDLGCCVCEWTRPRESRGREGAEERERKRWAAELGVNLLVFISNLIQYQAY